MKHVMLAVTLLLSTVAARAADLPPATLPVAYLPLTHLPSTRLPMRPSSADTARATRECIAEILTGRQPAEIW